MSATNDYSYTSSVKSDTSDELINTYLLRPLAGIIVRLLYPTPVTPNHVTLAAIGFGVLSALMYFSGSPPLTALAGLLLTLKDLLDSADGQLARAKESYSRAGRFLDSIGDVVVNFLVFDAITTVLFFQTGSALIVLLGALGFLGTTLRVSYHVFYHTTYLHMYERYKTNRVVEEMRPEDLAVDRMTLRLHRVYLWLYGWQDMMMRRIDRWCRKDVISSVGRERQWYGDVTAIRLSGLLGLGTELFLITACSLWNKLELYLYLNLVVMNGVWFASIVYRRWMLAQRIEGRKG